MSELAVSLKETPSYHPPWTSQEPQAFPVTLISTSPPGLSFLNASNLVPHRVQPKGHFSIVIFNFFIDCAKCRRVFRGNYYPPRISIDTVAKSRRKRLLIFGNILFFLPFFITPNIIISQQQNYVNTLNVFYMQNFSVFFLDLHTYIWYN